MDRMSDLEAFVAIVEKGSQTAAAKHLRRSLQSVGRSLVALEHSVGVELVRRTTRRSQPTDAGVFLYDRLKPALLQIAEVEREVAGKRTEPFGKLRIAAPVRFASAFVVPAVGELLRRHPQLDVTLTTSDRIVNVNEADVDVAIRIRDLPDSGLRVRKLGEMRVVVFGAPSYFAKHGRPRHPSELSRHHCVLRSAEPDAEAWMFRVRGKRKRVRVAGRFYTDDSAALHEAVAEGIGLGMTPVWQIRALLESRRVEIVLEAFEGPKRPVFAVSPATKIPQPKTRSFVELMIARLEHAQL